MAEVATVAGMRRNEVKCIEEIVGRLGTKRTALETGKVEVRAAVAVCRQVRTEGIGREYDEEVVNCGLKCGGCEHKKTGVTSAIAVPNRGRQWRAQRSCASPLHAGLAVRVDAAMALACGRNRGHAT